MQYGLSVTSFPTISSDPVWLARSRSIQLSSARPPNPPSECTMTNGEDAEEKSLQNAANAAWNASLVGECDKLGKAVMSSMRGRDNFDMPTMSSGVYSCRDRKAETFAMGDSLSVC